jgi:hypothetical protein
MMCGIKAYREAREKLGLSCDDGTPVAELSPVKPDAGSYKPASFLGIGAANEADAQLY